MSKQHYVLIHGACHGAWCWYKVTALLKSPGNKVSALDLGASGINPKSVEEVRSFSGYYGPLFDFMENLPAGERVVLVGHSMSGIGIAAAMEKFPEKISAAVFVAAAMPGPDLSVKDVSLEYLPGMIWDTVFEDPKFIWKDGALIAMLLGPYQMAHRLYRFSPPEDLELGLSLVRHVPFFSSEETVFTKKRYGKVPRYFIICDEEKGYAEQKWMVDNNPPLESRVISGSDHMTMFSKPQELASYLLEIGSKYPVD